MYQIQRQSWNGRFYTVVRVESEHDAREWYYEHLDAIDPIEGNYRVMWHGQLKFRFTV